METESYFVRQLSPENLNDPLLFQSLLRFYNQVNIRGGDKYAKYE